MVDVDKLIGENYKEKTSIIGKLYADRSISKEIIQKSMSKIWRIARPFFVLDIKPNMFIFSFENVEDMNCVMQRKSWLFETSLISPKAFDGNTLVTKMNFSMEALWVNMHDIPIGCMDAEMWSQIGRKYGL